jgi:hypothetical protein
MGENAHQIEGLRGVTFRMMQFPGVWKALFFGWVWLTQM